MSEPTLTTEQIQAAAMIDLASFKAECKVAPGQIEQFAELMYRAGFCRGYVNGYRQALANVTEELKRKQEAA